MTSVRIQADVLRCFTGAGGHCSRPEMMVARFIAGRSGAAHCPGQAAEFIQLLAALLLLALTT